MTTEPHRTCPSCGNEFSGAMEFCPVCMLRGALPGAAESWEPSASQGTVKPTSEQPVQRFDHYEETLENLIKRSGRLEAKLALEIVAQVAGGLAAVDKQKLVHRDIKPSNIMVNFEDDNRTNRGGP